jgi:hypothetical protein
LSRVKERYFAARLQYRLFDAWNGGLLVAPTSYSSPRTTPESVTTPDAQQELHGGPCLATAAIVAEVHDGLARLRKERAPSSDGLPFFYITTIFVLGQVQALVAAVSEWEPLVSSLFLRCHIQPSPILGKPLESSSRLVGYGSWASRNNTRELSSLLPSSSFSPSVPPPTPPPLSCSPSSSSHFLHPVLPYHPSFLPSLLPSITSPPSSSQFFLLAFSSSSSSSSSSSFPPSSLLFLLLLLR